MSATGGSAPYMGTGSFTVNAGTYNYTVTDANGCESAESTVTITEPAPVNVTTTVSGITITAVTTPATYQWIDCASNNTISGVTPQSFTAVSNGQYAVLVTESGCTDTSGCVSITSVGIGAFSANESLGLYPNPTTGSFTLILPASGNMSLRIVDVQGKQVMSLQETAVAGQNKMINVQHLNKGLYFVQLNIGQVNAAQKLVIE